MMNYSKVFDLDGRTVFVTGGHGLIGREIARAFASCGARTVVLDVRTERMPKGSGCSQEFFDITDLENVSEGVALLMKKYRSMDVWVNAAYPRTPDWGHKLESVSLASWQKNLNDHLLGYAWSSQQICLAMKRRGGVLINLGSIYGSVAPDFSLYGDTGMTSPVAYSVIKGGIVNLTRYLAAYFGEYGIRVNCVSPGGVADKQDKGFRQRYCRKTPLRRMALASDVAGAVLFLASDAAKYITGQNIMVDGGISIV